MSKLNIFLLFLSFCAQGQINTNIHSPEIVPTNPQETQFLRFGDVPVDEYSGRPEVTIPVYTLKTKAFDIPITLSYNAGGNKVNEEADWVGLGWHINTDMQIVQTVMGMDDYGRYRYPILPDFECLIRAQAGGLSAGTAMSAQSTFFLGVSDDWNQTHPGCYFNENFTSGVYDSQPDLFYFSMMGYSGKFVMDWQNGTFKCITDSNIKIEAPSYAHNGGNPVGEFIITVPDGHTFYFILKDESVIEAVDSAAEFAGSFLTNVQLVGEKSSRTFKLWQVITNKGDLLYLEYEKAKTTGTNPRDLVSKNFPNITQTLRTYQANNGSNLNMPFNGVINNYFATSQSYSFLSKITYNDVTLNFISSPRLDLVGSKKLDKIELRHKGRLIKNFIFSYDYFIGNSLGNNWDSKLRYFTYNTDKTPAELTHRLKLNAFQTFDSSLESSENPYTFEYNAQPLPKKTSYATDYWGYYNGMHSNNSLLPDIYKFNLERENTHYLDYRDNVNSPILSYSKAWILEKVKYPTGGYTKFDYELHAFSNFKVPGPAQGEKKSFNITAKSGGTTYHTIISRGSTILKGGYLLSTRGCTAPNAYSNTYIKIERFKPSLIPLVQNHPYGTIYALIMLGIPNATNQANYNQYIQDVQYVQMNYNDPAEVINNNYQATVGDGLVLFTVQGGCGTYNGTTNSSQAHLNLTYYDYGPLAETSAGGGLRVKNVTDYSGQDIIAKKTNYEYEGGKLMSPLLYFSKGIVNHFRQMLHFTGGECRTAAVLQANLEIAWNFFSSNPSAATAQNVQLAINAVNNSPECRPYVIAIDQYFNGYKNELSSGNFSNSLLSYSGRYVGYDKVIKKELKFSAGSTLPASNGRIENSYVNNPDISISSASSNGYFTDIAMPQEKRFPENGKKTREDIYDKDGVLKRSTVNTYIGTLEHCLWGMRCMPTDTYPGLVVGTVFRDTRSKYLIGVYPLKGGKSLLKTQQVSHFENGRELSQTAIFGYDSKNQLSSKKWIESNGDSIEEHFSYCYDIQAGNASASMVQRNFITPVIQTKKIVNQVPLHIAKTPYHYAKTPTFPGAFVMDRQMFAKSGNEADLKVLKQYFYDNVGNYKGTSDGIVQENYIIWGYRNMYPIAIIENVSATTVPPDLELAAVNLSNNGTEEQLLAALENIRNAPALANSRVTGMAYSPQVGVSVITDSKGQRTYYSYDTLGRLVETRDHNRNILTQAAYNLSH